MKTTLKKRIITYCLDNYYLNPLMMRFMWFYYLRIGGDNKLINNGMLKCRKRIIGRYNEIHVGRGSQVSRGTIIITGNNNRLIIGKNCKLGPDCTFFLVGNNNTITIGDGCTFTRKIELNAQESGSSIIIKEDCMFSNRIIVRTSDSHPIFDENNRRINAAKNIIIGKHVWVAPNSKIMKGSKIGDGCVIGSDTTVNKELPDNVLCVGRPCKVVRENIHWTRDPLF